MAILGAILLILALIVPALSVLFWPGVILLVVGLVLLVASSAGHGRRYY